MAIEFGAAHPADPGLPARRGLRPRRATWRCWPPTSRASRPRPEVVEAAARGAGAAPTATRTRPTRRCAGRCRTATAIPTQRIALGNGSCDILLAAGEALLEPGAEVVYAWPAFSVYPHLAAASGARAIEVPLDAEDRHDLDAMARRDHRGHPAGAGLQPQQPDLDRARRWRTIEAFLERVPRHVCVILDEAYCEFALALGDTVRLARAAAPLAQPGAAADVLQGLRAGRAAGRLRRCAAPRTSGPRSTRSASPSTSTWPPRPPRSRRCATRTRSSAASTHTVAARLELIDGLRELGLWVAESDANFVWTHLPEDVGRGRRAVAGCAERGVLVRAGRRWGASGCAPGDRRHRRRERPLPGRDGRAGLTPSTQRAWQAPRVW